MCQYCVYLCFDKFFANSNKARGSQTRGEAKEKTKLFVKTMYGFESGRSKKAVAANRKLAEELKREKGFIYEVSLIYSSNSSA